MDAMLSYLGSLSFERFAGGIALMGLRKWRLGSETLAGSPQTKVRDFRRIVTWIADFQ
jgi:hypothetical protein